MMWESYQKRILKLASIKNKILKYKILILSVLGVVVASIVTLMSIKGVVSNDIAFSSDTIVYGDSYSVSAKAIMSDVTYEYSSDKENWSEEQPTDAGTYYVHAITKSTFGYKTSKPKEFKILPYELQFPDAIDQEIEYSLLPTIQNPTTVYGDTVEEMVFDYGNRYEENPTVTLKSVLIMNQGRDVSKNYTFNSVSFHLNYTKKNTSVNASVLSMIYNGEYQLYTGSILLNGMYEEDMVSYTFELYKDGVKVEDKKVRDIGKYEIRAEITDVSDGANSTMKHYNISNEPIQFSVLPRPIEISTEYKEKVYDGTPLYSIDPIVLESEGMYSLLDGHTILITATSLDNQTEGLHQNTFTYKILDGTDDVSGLYEVKNTPGTVLITKRPITIQSNSHDDYIYDGTMHYDFEVKIISGTLALGQSYNSLMTTTITNATSCENVAEIEILDGTNDVTSNYEITRDNGTLTVLPRPITIKPLDLGYKVFDATVTSYPSYSLNYDVVSGNLIGTDSIILDATITNSNDEEAYHVGTYNVHATHHTLLGNPDNYQISYGEDTIYQITPKDLTISLLQKNTNKIYNAMEMEYSSIFSYTLDGDSYNSGNYNDTRLSSLTIGENSSDLVVEVYKDYTCSDKALNAIDANTYYIKLKAITKDLKNDYTITLASDVYSYTIKKRPILLSALYNDLEYTYTGQEMDVPLSMVYAGEYSLVNGDALTVTKYRIEGANGELIFKNATKYEVYCDEWQFTSGFESNYDITSICATVDILPLEVTLGLKDYETISYDGVSHESNHDFVYLSSNHFFEDISLELEVSYTYQNSSATPKHAGTYICTPTGEYVSLDTEKLKNYTITIEYTSKEFKILPIEVTITPMTNGLGDTYEFSGHTIDVSGYKDYEYISGQFLAGDSYSYTPILKGGNYHAGIQYITKTNGTFTTTNESILSRDYTFTFMDKAITITPHKVVIRGNDYQAIYGEDYSYSTGFNDVIIEQGSFKNSDGIVVTGIDYYQNSKKTSIKDCGEYSYKISSFESQFTGSDYEIVISDTYSTFILNRRSIQLTAYSEASILYYDGTSYLYDSKSYRIYDLLSNKEISSLPDGVEFTVSVFYTYSSFTDSRVDAKDAGNYYIYIDSYDSILDTNYDVSISSFGATLEIRPRRITVDMDSVVVEYTSMEASFDASYKITSGSFIGTDEILSYDIIYSGDTYNGKAVFAGSYTMKMGEITAFKGRLENYDIIKGSKGNLTITKAELTIRVHGMDPIIFDNENHYYTGGADYSLLPLDEANIQFTYSYKLGDVDSLSSMKNAGLYFIHISGVSTTNSNPYASHFNSNYSITYEDNTVTVLKRDVTVSLVPLATYYTQEISKSKYYLDDYYTFDSSLKGFIDVDVYATSFIVDNPMYFMALGEYTLSTLKENIIFEDEFQRNNYELHIESSTITVSALPVVLAPYITENVVYSNSSYIYDVNSYSITETTLSGTKTKYNSNSADIKITVEVKWQSLTKDISLIDGMPMHAGKYECMIISSSIDDNPCFSVSYGSLNLVILPKELMVETSDIEVTYTSEEIILDEALLQSQTTILGLLGNESLVLTEPSFIDGTVIHTGIYNATFENYEFTGGYPSDYTWKTPTFKCTVNPKKAYFEIVGPSEIIYDATDHFNEYSVKLSGVYEKDQIFGYTISNVYSEDMIFAGDYVLAIDEPYNISGSQEAFDQALQDYTFTYLGYTDSSITRSVSILPCEITIQLKDEVVEFTNFAHFYDEDTLGYTIVSGTLYDNLTIRVYFEETRAPYCFDVGSYTSYVYSYYFENGTKNAKNCYQFNYISGTTEITPHIVHWSLKESYEATYNMSGESYFPNTNTYSGSNSNGYNYDAYHHTEWLYESGLTFTVIFKDSLGTVYSTIENAGAYTVEVVDSSIIDVSGFKTSNYTFIYNEVESTFTLYPAVTSAYLSYSLENYEYSGEEIKLEHKQIYLADSSLSTQFYYANLSAYGYSTSGTSFYYDPTVTIPILSSGYYLVKINPECYMEDGTINPNIILEANSTYTLYVSKMELQVLFATNVYSYWQYLTKIYDGNGYTLTENDVSLQHNGDKFTNYTSISYSLSFGGNSIENIVDADTYLLTIDSLSIETSLDTSSISLTLPKLYLEILKRELTCEFITNEIVYGDDKFDTSMKNIAVNGLVLGHTANVTIGHIISEYYSDTYKAYISFYKVLDDKGNDVTKNYNLNTSYMTYVIKPCAIEINILDYDSIYTGNSLSNFLIITEEMITVSSGAFVSSDTLTVEVNYTTLDGEEDSPYDIGTYYVHPLNGVYGHYDVTFVGTTKVTIVPNTVKISFSTKDVTYSGNNDYQDHISYDITNTNGYYNFATIGVSYLYKDLNTNEIIDKPIHTGTYGILIDSVRIYDSYGNEISEEYSTYEILGDTELTYRIRPKTLRITSSYEETISYEEVEEYNQENDYKDFFTVGNTVGNDRVSFDLEIRRDGVFVNTISSCGTYEIKPVHLTYSKSNQNDYTVISETKRVIVTEAQIEIYSIVDDSDMYDGIARSADETLFSYSIPMENVFVVSVTYSYYFKSNYQTGKEEYYTDQILYPGTYDIYIASFVIVDAYGNDISSNFKNISTKTGKFVRNRKTIDITTGSGTFYFDATVHVVTDGFQTSSDISSMNHMVIWNNKPAGDQSDPTKIYGLYPGVYTNNIGYKIIDLTSGEEVSKYYTIGKTNYGTITILKRKIAITTGGNLEYSGKLRHEGSTVYYGGPSVPLSVSYFEYIDITGDGHDLHDFNLENGYYFDFEIYVKSSTKVTDVSGEVENHCDFGIRIDDKESKYSMSDFFEAIDEYMEYGILELSPMPVLLEISISDFAYGEKELNPYQANLNYYKFYDYSGTALSLSSYGAAFDYQKSIAVYRYNSFTDVEAFDKNNSNWEVDSSSIIRNAGYYHVELKDAVIVNQKNKAENLSKNYDFTILGVPSCDFVIERSQMTIITSSKSELFTRSDQRVSTADYQCYVDGQKSILVLPLRKDSLVDITSDIPYADINSTEVENKRTYMVTHNNIDVTQNYIITYEYGLLTLTREFILETWQAKTYDAINVMNLDNLTYYYVKDLKGTEIYDVSVVIHPLGYYSDVFLTNEVSEVMHVGTYYIKYDPSEVRIYANGEDLTDFYIPASNPTKYITFSTVTYDIVPCSLYLSPRDVEFNYDGTTHYYEDAFIGQSFNFSNAHRYSDPLPNGYRVEVRTSYSIGTSGVIDAGKKTDYIKSVFIYDETNTLVFQGETIQNGSKKEYQYSYLYQDDFELYYDYYSSSYYYGGPSYTTLDETIKIKISDYKYQFVVNKINVMVKTYGKTVVYDGTKLSYDSSDAYEWLNFDSKALDGHYAVVKPGACYVPSGNTMSRVNQIKFTIYDALGNDVSKNYLIEYSIDSGYITVLERTIYIQTGSATREYIENEPLVCETYSIVEQGDGLAYGHSIDASKATYTVIASDGSTKQIYAGTGINTVSDLVILDENGRNVTKYYTVIILSGYVIVV